MKKSIVTFIHIGFWICYSIAVALLITFLKQSELLGGEDPNYFLAMTVGAFFVPQVFAFYSYYSFLFPTYLQKRKIWMSALGGFVLSVLGISLGLITVKLISAEAFQCVQTGIKSFSIFIFIITTITGIIALVLKGFFTWFGEIKLKEALLKKNYEMELALVKAQLDPHFLFNTINNIDILILKKPEEASKYLNKLSDIMRFMLHETKADFIPLKKEIEYIEKYIQLQQIRTANENYIRFEVIGEPNGKLIAPMAFISFVENAFKHSTNKKIEHAIRIQITIEKSLVRFECTNKFDPMRPSNQEVFGLGNELIQKRLALLYPTKHKLSIQNEKDIYSVQLTINNE